jgi:thiol-disulfide isomerase/thioredoxin
VIGLFVALAALAFATVFGLVWRRRNGVLRSGGESVAVQRLGPADLGEELGERATLVQFSTAFCAPCRATRRILDDVTGLVAGVRHVEIDAESHLDLVRRLNVMRTPTVLVLDGSGRVVRRASGQPRKVEVLAALGEVVP